MLSTISLDRFKSFASTDDLDIKPITILSGQNSSGKSTIIQTLLILKQTVGSPMFNEPIVLNGALVSLGTYFDVLNYSASPSDGFKLSFEFNIRESKSSIRYRRSFIHPAMSGRVRLDLAFSNVNEKNSGYDGDTPELELFTLRGALRESPEFVVELRRNSELLDELSEKFNIDASIVKEFQAWYSVGKQSRGTPRPEGVVFQSFLPQAMLRPYHRELILEQDRILDQFIELLANRYFSGTRDQGAVERLLSRNSARSVRWTRPIQLMFRQLRFQHGSYPSSDGVNKVEVDECIRLLEKVLEDDRPEFRDISDREQLKTVLGQLDVDSLISINMFLEEAEYRIEKVKGLPRSLRVEHVGQWEITNTPYHLSDVLSLIHYSLDGLYYLGPLREEPKAFYQRLGSPDPMYVGQRGENVAFVLKYYSNQLVPTVIPDLEHKEWNPMEARIERLPLRDAVNLWLQYLDIANNITIEEMGKLGLTVKANIHGEGEADLTNVGVGVSQVLPLVVLGLASPEDAILLLEQPELHLHPYIQSRLGDFFVGLSRVGKQVIAETHSEHLIHRMRLHIARGNISNDKDIAVYFFEVDNGISQIKRVDIDEFGSIKHWPAGFFDETERQLDDIITAALNRLDSESENGGHR